MKKERNIFMTTQSVSLETSTKVLKETKEEGIRKRFIIDGVYIPQLECKKLQFNQSKLRSEERILNLILQRAWGAKRKMGPESALLDMLAYLKKWKKENHGWQKQSKEKLRELQITIEGVKNGKEKINA
jgi:hypothetical protein